MLTGTETQYYTGALQQVLWPHLQSTIYWMTSGRLLSFFSQPVSSVFKKQVRFFCFKSLVVAGGTRNGRPVVRVSSLEKV